jgi:hypothetical protein
MSDSPLVGLIVTLLTSNVSAQITSVKENPALFDKSRQIWQEMIENRDSKSIVAVHASFDCPERFPLESGRYVTFGRSGEYDALGTFDVFEDPKGISPGGAVTIAAADPSKCRGGVDAVIFSDGQIEGSSRWVNEYHQRWSGVHEGVIESLPLLAKLANQEADLAEVEGALRHCIESIPDHPFDLKRGLERGVYRQLESLLRDAWEHPKPRSEEVEANGIPRKQAQKMGIFLVNKLQEWKTALESGLGSPASN